MADNSDENDQMAEAGLRRLLDQLAETPYESDLAEQAQLVTLPRHLSYAAVVDVRNAETEITDMMVKRACKEAESQMQFPFAPKKSAY